jgi:hypothetical protein
VLGAALAAVDVSTKHAEISAQMMGLVIATCLAVYSTYLWLFYEAFIYGLASLDLSNDHFNFILYAIYL